MITRRQLIAAGVVIVAGGGGAAAGWFRPVGHDRVIAAVPPPGLTAALTRERELLAALALALRTDPALRTRLGQVHADHAAHAVALQSAIQAHQSTAPSTPTATATITPAPAETSSLAQLRAAELSAAHLAAAESSALTGADAALLASISACESTHAELLA
jgi:hypothetical protein